MRKMLFAAAILAAGTTTVKAWPGMFLFGGYMTIETAQECRQILLDACNGQFGSCKSSDIGKTLAVDYAQDQYNFSMQCTYFPAIKAVVYSVSGAAEVGKGQTLRDKVVAIKSYIDATAK